jgi:hypothetical protein
VNIFTQINNYASMAEAANVAETPAQLINIGLIIITRATIFASDIRKWHTRPAIDKTWPNFKDHFKNAQKAIKLSQPATTTDTLGYHNHANTATEIDNTAELIAAQQMQHHLKHIANAVEQNKTMAAQMTALTDTIANLQTQVNNNNQPRGRHNGGRGGGRHNNRNKTHGRTNGNGTRPPPQYCWTHGNCAHNGTSCNTPATGHIIDATYTNMQGGSTTNCHWL